MIGKLYFYTGKMGAGKSTHSLKLAEQCEGVHMSEDEWLSILYPDDISTFEDYLRLSLRIKPLLTKHIQQILHSGVDVVLDFPANTQKQRQWFRQIIDEANVDHQLIYIKVSDKVCLQQIKQRRETSPERVKFDTEDMFHHVTQYFEEPQLHENFKVEIIS